MKKCLVVLSAIAICAAIVAALVAFKNHQKQEQLLQESIAAFEAGDFQKARDGFKTLKQEMDDPDLDIVYRFLGTMQLWQSEDVDDKLEAFERAQYENISYDGLLAEDIHRLTDIILEEGAKLKAEVDAQRKEELLQRIKEGKPYVGMDAQYIDMTSLGRHDDTNYNMKKIGNKDHRCTLYYWMDGSRCIFIARVQDDIGEVIDISENPSGSYFGN